MNSIYIFPPFHDQIICKSIFIRICLRLGIENNNLTIAVKLLPLSDLLWVDTLK